MYNLKEFNDAEIIGLIEDGKIGEKDFIDSGICPTCFDKENNHLIYGDKTDTMIFEDDLFVTEGVYEVLAAGILKIEKKILM